MTAYRQTPTTPGILLFCLFVFMLVTAPRASIRIGPIPLYFIDVVLITMVWYFSIIQRVVKERLVFSISLLLWAIFVVFGEIIGMFRFETYIESLYITVRIFLAMSVFFIAFYSLNHVRDIEFLLKVICVGLIISSVLMIMSSLPGTRSFVANNVFSIGILEPAAGRMGNQFQEGETGVRGRTLVGVSILGASFINICWPFAALLWRWPWNIGRWRTLAVIACLLAPMGVLMSYSRGPIIGTVLMVLVALSISLKRVKRGVLLPVMAGALVVLFIGASSQLFFFDRLTNRTEAIFDAPFEDKAESERTLAYVEPWYHILEHPRFILVGEGIGVRYSSSRIRPEQAGQATHAVFAMGYYSYGLIASLLFIAIFVRSGLYVRSIRNSVPNSVADLLAPALLLSLVGMAPWLIFGHAAISTPRGAMLFFLVLGLVASLSKLANLRWERADMGVKSYG